MNWNLYWLIVFVIEVAIFAYITLINYEIKELQKPKHKKINVVYEKPHEKTKMEIMEG